MIRLSDIVVIAPNLKRRLSGVTSTIVRLVPLQARDIGIATTGPGLPDDLPHIALWRCALLPRNNMRVWHARRNTEMLVGLILRYLFGRRLKLMFTSAAQRRHSAYTRWLIRRMDHVVATSRKSAAYLEVPHEVIRHGIDLTAFHPSKDKAAEKAALGLPDVQVVGIFGRVRAQKGNDLFVEALLKVLDRGHHVHGLMIGLVTDQERGFLEDLKAKIAAAGRTDSFTILDPVDWQDLLCYYRALDLFTAPARWEGFGLTPLEAMASGVPAIATPVGAFEEQIVDGQTGRIIPVDDADALADAIAASLADPEVRAEWELAGRARVEALFAIEREAEKL
ncbi:MAG: glycosyltransferase family 4 protein, partial [Pseudomonadota bacterium]